MIFLIRYKNDDTSKFYDVKMAGARIKIGSGLDQHILTPGIEASRSHATIRATGKSDSSARLVCYSGKRIRLNGELVGSANLKPGDVIQLAAHRIRVIQTVEGFDFSCEVDVDPKKLSEELSGYSHTEFAAKKWTPRRLAYGMTLLLLLFAFLLPYFAYLSSKSIPVSEDQFSDIMSVIESLDDNSWRGDVLWSPGPLAVAHQNVIGNNCSSCHTQAFQPVADQSCLNCHDESQQHFDANFLRNVMGRLHAGSELLDALGPDSSASPDTLVSLGIRLRCESCHKEHNEPSTIIATVDTLCTQCHEMNLDKMDGSMMQIATAFNPLEHPEFRYSMLVHRSDDDAQILDTRGIDLWRRIKLSANEAAVEESNLEFSHELHLQLDEPTLSCSSCHRLDVGNEHFETITMRDHCADCHKLEFNGREIPHGDASLAIRSIEEYFIAMYVAPNREPETPPRRLPGRLVRSCEGTDYECAIAKAEEEIQLQFNNSGCVTCHRVSSIENPEFGRTPGDGLGVGVSTWSPLSQSWYVEEVRLNDDWYGNSNFDHASHLTQTGQSEVELCSSCHEATTSDLSSDVLIPKSENCFQCHSGSTSDNKIVMGCVNCHSHHPANNSNRLEAEFARERADGF